MYYYNSTHCCINYSHFSIGISLVDETVAEPEVPSEQEKQLTQGIQFAYTVPSNDTSQAQEVCTTYVGVGWRGARGNQRRDGVCLY